MWFPLRECKTRLERDDVLAEWKKVDGELSLYVHCYVSGANLLQELATEFRYYIFSKELPLVSYRNKYLCEEFSLSFETMHTL